MTHVMILTVASFKGGVAKTTTAIHLAAYLSTKSDPLLIDGDPNQAVTGWQKRGELPFKVVDEGQAAKYAPNFSQIIIDTQARPKPEDLEALASGCDLLILPTTPDALSLEALTLTVASLKAIGTERFKVLLTIVPPRPNKDGEEARAMLQEAGLPVLNNWVRRYSAFQKAALSGVPVYRIHEPNAMKGWHDYQSVCEELGL